MKAPKFEHKFEAQDLGEFTKQLDESIGMMKMVFGGIALSPYLLVVSV